MERLIQYDMAIVQEAIALAGYYPTKNCSHCSLVYVKEGSGNVLVNKISFSYKAESFFALGPGDSYRFLSVNLTRYIVLAFNDQFAVQQKLIEPSSLEQIFYLPNNRIGGFILANDKKEAVGKIFDLVASLTGKNIHNEQLIYALLPTLMKMLESSISKRYDSDLVPSNRTIQNIFSYIHSNICNPNKLKATAIADKFNTTENYIGKFFKRNTGIALRDYILKYRKTLIQRKLQSNYTVKEVVEEFGLTDESHLGKLLRDRNTGNKKATEIPSSLIESNTI